MAIPLVFQDKLIGVIDVESTDVGAFTEQHEEVMKALAFHIATAVANAQLYEGPASVNVGLRATSRPPAKSNVGCCSPRVPTCGGSI